VRMSMAFLLISAAAAWGEPATVRVMSFNLWHGGQAGGQPLKQSAAVIEAAGADIVGLQERTARTAPAIRQKPSRNSLVGIISNNRTKPLY
jgi:exodeoxyribonuclease III